MKASTGETFMPQMISLLNIDGFELENISGLNPIIFKIRYVLQANCPHCHSNDLRIKDTFYRWIRHESLGARKVYLYLRTHKYRCNTCSRYFNDRFPGILPYRRSTEAFRREVFYKHHDGICQKVLADRLGLGQATIERWYQSLLELKLSRRQNEPCPRVLGIDEHFFTRKQGYATTFCDLAKHKVFDVALGRTEKALAPFLHELYDKRNVRVVVIDLSETYRNLVRKNFPNAHIVADRFHVIRLINHHFMKVWQLIDPLGRKNRGLLSLMRRHEQNLTDFQKMRLETYFTEFPALKVIWNYKHKLCRLLSIKRRTKRQCKRLIPIFLRMAEALRMSPFEPLSTLGKTLQSWDKEIVQMWRFTKSNGITEGFHNKMELINRRAYGFRNFQNYRLRVRTLCA
jgi:transposase